MANSTDCFVYIQLPGTVELVACGRFEIQHTRAGVPIGRFVYGRSYRARPDAVPIDPYHLPITSTVQETTKLNGVFGAIRDAAPDAWGRTVIHRINKRSDFGEIDLLLESPEDRAGALSFGRGPTPPAPVRAYNRVLQLGELRVAAAIIEEDHPGVEIPQQLLDLLDPGTSMGGARPKNVVEDETGLWIAKFPAKGDRWDNAAVEAGMLSLASRCGIRVPETRVESLGEESVLLVKRFDRELITADDGTRTYLRHRMVSALTVLDAEESPTDRENWSYIALADELQRWSSRPDQDKVELFRRVVFNGLISNLDDHPRNHALIAPGRDWLLAPAYDLTPNPRQGLEERRLAMECGRFGRMARRDNIISEAAHFGLREEEADVIISEMKGTIDTYWRSEVLRNGGTDRDCLQIEGAFTYPGFEYDTRK